MASQFKSFLNRFTPNQSSTNLSTSGFSKAPKGKLFPATDPTIDGEDCLHDCSTCSVKYPAKWSIDEEDELYGQVKGWSTHLIVATGKTDWVRDVADEKGSIMEAVEKSKVQPSNGKLMLSASDMPIPHSDFPDQAPTAPESPGKFKKSTSGPETCTMVLLLPAFQYIENVTPSSVPDLVTHIINNAPTNTTPLNHTLSTSVTQSQQPTTPPPTEIETQDPTTDLQTAITNLSIPSDLPHNLKIRPCPHKYLILLCSQRTRDARCGQSAPLLRREFERHLRPLGLYRDHHDERPGGCGIYFISHVGGHKYAANVFVYRRGDAAGVKVAQEGGAVGEGEQEAAQCIWLARVRPEDCENIVRYTLLQGKVVKPDRQLRGGFDRGKGLVSW